MLKINGYSIIAKVTDLNNANEAVVLGVRHDAATGLPVEYVTGRVRSDDDQPTEWHAGHYFHVEAARRRDSQVRAYADQAYRAHIAEAVDSERERVGDLHNVASI